MSPELKANQILSGTPASPAELLDLVAQLIGVSSFHYARRILALAIRSPEAQNDPALRRKCMIRRVVCTYKDQELAADQRLSMALHQLAQIDDLDHTTDQEILGLAGAVHKRQFELYARQEYLERAAAYYLRGYREGIENDYGYTAINAAFILDSLATRELVEVRAAGAESQTAGGRYDTADAIRREIIYKLEVIAGQKADLERNWWFLVTIAEAWFGLREYARAAELVRRARRLSVDPWIYQGTVRQFSALAGLAAERDKLSRLPSEMDAVWSAFGIPPEAASSVLTGSVGLALSGGGFRAALFHIGLLARLADLDLLRNVEVISGVSGGSILAAYYYLELKRLLERKPDAEITRQDYIDIVSRIEVDFLLGVQISYLLNNSGIVEGRGELGRAALKHC
jgi:hypothetical protein